MSKQRSARVALTCRGIQARAWAAAFRGQAQLCPMPDQLPADIDALIITPGTGDPFALAKEALQASVPVFYAAPFLLSPWQAATLHMLSSEQRSLLHYVEPFQHQTGFAFLRRLLAGKEPLWQPLYLRSTRLVRADSSARIDEIATEELASYETLLQRPPCHVTATASSRAAVGGVCAVFLTIQYQDGPPVQCTISLAETTSVRQLVAVTSSRTVILDEQDPIAPVRVIGDCETGEGAQGHVSFIPGHDSRAAFTKAASCDPVVEEATRFLDAVSSGGAALGNGERWASVAALWWAARQSMSFGGTVDVPSFFLRPGNAKPPPLRLIQGGGKTASAAGKRPALTVVTR